MREQAEQAAARQQAAAEERLRAAREGQKVNGASQTDVNP